MLVGTEALFIRKEYPKSSSLFGASLVCACVHVRIDVCVRVRIYFADAVMVVCFWTCIHFMH